MCILIGYEIISNEGDECYFCLRFVASIIDGCVDDDWHETHHVFIVNQFKKISSYVTIKSPKNKT